MTDSADNAYDVFALAYAESNEATSGMLTTSGPQPLR